jgi:chitinase
MERHEPCGARVRAAPGPRDSDDGESLRDAGSLSWATGFQPAWTDLYPGTTPPTVQFLTYEDAAGIAAKGAWAKANGYGGAIIWTINEGTQYPYGNDGYANPLLDAAGQAFR